MIRDRLIDTMCVTAMVAALIAPTWLAADTLLKRVNPEHVPTTLNGQECRRYGYVLDCRQDLTRDAAPPTGAFADRLITAVRDQ